MPSDYHHGDLPAALRAATVELIAEVGPANFSLREVARRAGVSHSAPAHHFGDTTGLITSVAAEGFAVVAERMTEASRTDGDAKEQLTRLGKAYVYTALANPGHYRVMIGHDHINKDDPDLLAASTAAYDELLTVVRALRDQYNPDLDVDRTATLLWSTVHGIVELAPITDHVAAKTGTTNPAIDDLLEAFSDLVVDGIRA